MRNLAIVVASMALVVCSRPAPALAGGKAPLMGQAQGEVMPGLVPGEFVISGSGRGTLTGPFTIEAEHVYVAPDLFVGSMTFTAPNGDVLAANYTGQSLFIPGPGGGIIAVTDTIEAVVDSSRSTGVYAGATGTFTVKSGTDLETGIPFSFGAFFAGSIILR